jgi:predicted CXXCH cytochrome family protein
LTDFSRRAFFKDGRLRETTFIGEAFMRSACYRRGQAQCGHCHNPHPADAATNPTSLKDRDRPDQMCLQCHTGYASRIEAHTHHPVSSDGSRCVNCHMPRIMNSLLFQARTHQIDDIPRADTALRFGQKESPNACLLCHQDKDGQWIASRLQSW